MKKLLYFLIAISLISSVVSAQGIRPNMDSLRTETNLLDGEIGFRQHKSGHTPTPNWPYFIQYAERYFK